MELDAVIPIQNILKVKAGCDYKKGVEFTIKAGNAQQRQIDIASLKRAIIENPYFRSDLKELFLHEKYLLITKDVVLNNYSAEIKVDKKINPELDVSLSAASVVSAIGSVTVSTSVTRSSDGKYTITSTEPVIVGALHKISAFKPVSNAASGKVDIKSVGAPSWSSNLDNFDNWPVIDGDTLTITSESNNSSESAIK